MSLPFVFATATTAAGIDIDNDLNAVGLLGTIPCTVSGTNALTLTPSTTVAGTPPVSGLQALLRFSGIAAAANTGAVTANVAGLGILNVYKDTPTGPTALTGGELYTGNEFVLIYDATLNSGNGGYHVDTTPGASLGTVTSVVAGSGLAGGTIATVGTIALANIADSRVMANISGGNAVPSAQTMTGIFDHVFGSTQGSILSRGASVWAVSGEATFAPVVTLGGASTSITYATQQGYYFQIGYMVFATYNIVLASKGSGSGNVSISLPVAAGGGSRSGGGLVTSYTSLSSVTSALWANVPASASVASLLYSAGPAAPSALTDTNMQNSTALAGVIMYLAG